MLPCHHWHLNYQNAKKESKFEVYNSVLAQSVSKWKLHVEFKKKSKIQKNAIFSPKWWWVQISAEVVFYENQYFKILSVI